MELGKEMFYSDPPPFLKKLLQVRTMRSVQSWLPSEFTGLARLVGSGTHYPPCALITSSL